MLKKSSVILVCKARILILRLLLLPVVVSLVDEPTTCNGQILGFSAINFAGIIIPDNPHESGAAWAACNPHERKVHKHIGCVGLLFCYWILKVYSAKAVTFSIQVLRQYIMVKVK